MKIARNSTIGIVCVCALMIWAAAAYTSPLSAQDDILQTLQLEGYHCDEITDVDHRAVADYVATCSNGARYQVVVTPGGRLLVLDLDQPASAESQRPASHPELIKRSLTAVIHLADASCGAVVSVVTVSPREHLATCTNKIRYKVRATADGKVHVDEG